MPRIFKSEVIQVIISVKEAEKMIEGKLYYLAENVLKLEGRNGKFLCPFHSDNKPSMKYYYDENNEHMYCFACNKSYTVVDLYKHLKGARNDIEAYEIALADLGHKNITVVKEKNEYYKLITSLLDIAEEIHRHISIHNLNDKAKDFLHKKGIYDPMFLKKRGIGQIKRDDLDYLFNRLTEKYGKAVEFFNKSFFAENMLVFTIYNYEGKPVAFASRNLDFDEKNYTLPKYVNTKNSPIYKKKINPYGVDLINPANVIAGYSYVYIVEGYTDAVAMHSNNIKNTIALGGTALSMELVKRLRDLGIELIIFMLDGDEAGRNSVLEFITKKLPYTDMLVGVKRLPDGVDPDEYLKKYGASSLERMRLMSAPEYVLRETKDITLTLNVMENIRIIEEENMALRIQDAAKELGIEFNAYKYLYNKTKKKYEDLKDYVKNKIAKQLALLEVE